ncbi:hypothetical protein BASA61_003434 [Batrachochytrium salamandrivorans]|nr:hypothetical protein BASA61_003434 [Batrachochytrium salamandrivorans]
MKLISFAVISFLAITVSAYPGLGASAADDTLQSDRDLINDKIDEFTTAHQLQEELVLTISGFEEVKEKEQEAKSVMKGLAGRLTESHLSRVDQLDLEEQYNNAEKDWNKAYDTLMLKKDDVNQAEGKRDGIKMKLLILNENVQQQTKQGAHSKGQTGASPDSNHPRNILERQIKEACRNAENLVAVNHAIKESVYALDDVMHREKEPDTDKLCNPRKQLCDSRQNLAKEMHFLEDKCFYAKRLQIELGWQPPISLPDKIFQTIWKGLGMN